MRITDREKEVKLKAKSNLTKEEEIYLKLATYENAEEDKNLFTKNQLNLAITKCADMLGNIIKVKITKEILLTLLSELKKEQVDGKVTTEKIEAISNEIIKRVAEVK
jgi:hypothetical protein